MSSYLKNFKVINFGRHGISDILLLKPQPLWSTEYQNNENPSFLLSVCPYDNLSSKLKKWQNRTFLKKSCSGIFGPKGSKIRNFGKIDTYNFSDILQLKTDWNYFFRKVLIWGSKGPKMCSKCVFSSFTRNQCIKPFRFFEQDKTDAKWSQNCQIRKCRLIFLKLLFIGGIRDFLLRYLF